MNPPGLTFQCPRCQEFLSFPPHEVICSHCLKSSGWKNALYYFSRERVTQNLPLLEDQRTADWIYMLPAGPETEALVMGCGWGTVPTALAQLCRRVTAVDTVPEKVAFLEARLAEARLGEGVNILHLEQGWNLPFSSTSFDLICLNEFQPKNQLPFYEVVRHLDRLLKPGGLVVLHLANRWSLQSLLQSKKNRKTAYSQDSLSGYFRTLRQTGFSEIQVFAPLPRFDGIPLFYLPMENPAAINFFFRSIFPLFEMVSPESKKAYAFEYAAAKIGVWMARALHLTRFSKYFFSGFLFIARKSTLNE